LKNCTGLTPNVNTVDYGQAFTQNKTCYQDQKLTYSYKYNTSLITTREETKTLSENDSQPAVGTRKTQWLCSDILSNHPSSNSGIYTVDPDGDLTTYNTRPAYCHMTDGGWTLYDNFGNKNITANALVSGYNFTSINSYSTIASAGYSSFVNAINTTSYEVVDGYMQFFASSDPIGYLEKTMPSWVNEIRVDTDHTWYSGYNTYSLGSTSISEPANQGRTEKVLSGSGLLRIEETLGIVWIDAVWVK
jgi:hypothetical protein